MNDMLETDLREIYAERDASYDPSAALDRIHARAGRMPIGRRRGRRALALAVAPALVAAVGVFIVVNGGERQRA